MTNFADPQTYFGIATGVITLATGAVTVLAGWAKLRADRAYPDRVDKLCVSLDAPPPSRDASLGVRYRWAESLREFDELTLPRPNVAAALLGMVFTCLCAWASFMLFLGAIFANGTASVLQRMGVAGAASMFAVYTVVGWLFVDELSSHRYRLRGKRLDRNSPHLDEIRTLRRDYGVAGRADELADRGIRTVEARVRRVKRIGICVRRFMRWPWMPTARTRRAKNVAWLAAQLDAR